MVLVYFTEGKVLDPRTKKNNWKTVINSQHNMSDNVITSSFLPNQDHYFLKIENEQKSFFSLKKVWKFM